MADYYGMARTNAFRVKDYAAFRDALSHVEIIISTRVHDDGAERVTLITNTSHGHWPNHDDRFNQLDWGAIFCDHLAENEVAIVISAGHERARYVTGVATAYHQDGREHSVFLSDIYAQAAEAFGVPEANITIAEYRHAGSHTENR